MKMALFLAHLKARNCSLKTIKDYESDLKLFEGFLKQRHLRVTQVKPQTIDQFVEWLRSRHNYKTGTTGMADASIRRRLSSLSSFYDFLRATSNGRISNPVGAT